MAQELEISVGSVHTIISNRLGMRKVSARWIPHRLTSNQAQRRLKVATANFTGFSTVGEDFLSRIVSIDETGVRSYESELKRQSAEWHTPSSPRYAKFWRVHSKLKMLMIFVYDIRGVFTTHKVPAGKTVNGKY